jgi:hypothetical protein
VSTRAFRKILHSLDSRRSRLGPVARVLWFSLALILTGLLALTDAANGAGGAASALVYLPILLAAFLFGTLGALVTAVLAGLALPLLALGTAEGEMISFGGRLPILGGYLVAGTSCGIMFRTLRAWREDATKLHDSALKTFAALVETYDTDTGAHCERVAANACALGRKLGLPDRQLKQLHWAGYLHDLGKVVLPSEVLRKPGKLSPAEMELVRQHPGVGARLLTGISETFQEVADGPASHHERWDGSGYPLGLQREEIPLFGRILAVVDVFEALTSDRPYQQASPVETALGIVRSGAGTAFDPRLVMLYEQLYWEGELHIFGQQDKSLRLTPSRETLWDLTNPTPAQERTVLDLQEQQSKERQERSRQPALHAA